MKKIFLIPLITIYQLLFTFAAPPARADFNLAINPPIIQIEAKPPANVSAPFEVQNLGNDTLNLQISLKPFLAADTEDGQVKYLKDSEVQPGYFELFQNVRIIEGDTDLKTLTLSPKQKKELTLNINIPRDSIPNDYYFSIVLVSLSSQTTDRNVTESLGGLAINVLLTVGADLKAQGVIQEFSSPIFVEKGPVPFTVRVKNTGSNYLTPKGEIIIKNLIGEDVGRVDLLPVNILANSVRSIPSEDQIDKASWRENIIIGPYRAVLNLSLSENGPKFQRELIFFAFPYGGALAVLGIFFILLYLFSRLKGKI